MDWAEVSPLRGPRADFRIPSLSSSICRLIVFPRKAGKPKAGDSSEADLKAETTRAAIPLPVVYEREAPRAITSEEKEFEAYRTLRVARAAKRNAGQAKKRAE